MKSVPVGDDGIDAFVSEAELVASPVRTSPSDLAVRVEPRPPRGASLAAVKWVAVVALSAGAAAAGMWVYQRSPAQPLPASLTLQTTPPGMAVSIGGKPSGSTPVTVSLAAGNYPIVLSAPDGRRRDLAVTLSAGGSVVQHVEMPAVEPLAGAATGALHIETDPGRQTILIDGIQRGTSPLTVPSLSPGEHVVGVRTANGTLRRTIVVKEGETVSLVISAPAANAVRAGWIEFVSPVVLELRENGSVVGTTASDRVMLPAGDHQIELVNDALGFRATRQVSVAADRTTSVPVNMPNGTLSINALPWAEVWVGGERVGETPIANLSRPIGSYDVLLRHPQLGERRATVTVSTKQPARLGVDMRNP